MMNLNLAAKGEAAEERLELAGEGKPVQGCQVCKGKPETDEMKCSAPPAQICAQDAQHSVLLKCPFYLFTQVCSHFTRVPQIYLHT